MRSCLAHEKGALFPFSLSFSSDLDCDSHVRMFMVPPNDQSQVDSSIRKIVEAPSIDDVDGQGKSRARLTEPSSFHRKFGLCGGIHVSESIIPSTSVSRNSCYMAPSRKQVSRSSACSNGIDTDRL